MLFGHQLFANINKIRCKPVKKARPRIFLRLCTLSSCAVTSRQLACGSVCRYDPLTNKQSRVCCNTPSRRRAWPARGRSNAVGRASSACMVPSISIHLGTRVGSIPECAGRESSVVSLGTNDLVRVFMSHVPQQGFVNVAGSRADLTRSTVQRSDLGHWLRCEALSQGVRKRAVTSCDHDRLRKRARLVTYCSRMKQSKLCTFTLSQAQRPAACRSCLISDGERQNGTLSEECVVTTEVGSTHSVEVLPSQQMFDVKVFVTLTPSARSHRPPLAPLVDGDLF